MKHLYNLIYGKQYDYTCTRSLMKCRCTKLANNVILPFFFCKIFFVLSGPSSTSTAGAVPAGTCGAGAVQSGARLPHAICDCVPVSGGDACIILI